MAQISLVFLFQLILAMRGADADPFLQKTDAGNDLLRDLQFALGPNWFQGRLEVLRQDLQPMFVSLPKDSRGLLSHASARYALHRISMARHGWTINGLEPSMDNFNTSSLMDSGILRDVVPAHIEHIFVKHIGEDGLSLQSLVILAGTIDHLIRMDQHNFLRKACELLDVPTLGSIGDEEMRNIIQLYMVSFLRAGMIPPEHYDRYIKHAWTKIHKEYPGWEETTLLLDDERETVAYNERGRTNIFKGRENSLGVAQRVVEQVADHFPLQQCQPECLEIKEDLLAYEQGDTGRVRLIDFYRAGLDSRFYFIETKEYLRALGALDESDERMGPKVIVSNYVLAKSNCLARAHLYSVCCFNECEDLYGKFEQALAAPEVKPQQISMLVANMSTSTVQAPRNLSQALLRRLDEIAVGPDGTVLLHSRLFAQWMHQAFPRECPYPHLVGKTTSLDPKAWAKQNGQNYSVGRKSSLQSHVQSLELAEQALAEGLTDAELAADDADLMWTSEEEHFVQPVAPLSMRVWNLVGTLGRGGALLAFFASLLFALRASSELSSGGKRVTEQQYFV